jgi:hypothetical protein
MHLYDIIALIVYFVVVAGLPSSRCGFDEAGEMTAYALA